VPNRAVSVVLDVDNLLWLRAQGRATNSRGLSDTLNRIITEARRAGRVDPHSIRSVVGTVEIPEDHPELERADVYIRALFEQSLGRPVAADQHAPGTRRRRRTSRRG
jgi:hypothetical protein